VAELETTVSLLSQVGACRSPSCSPDGRRMAFVSDLSGNPQVWTVEVGGGWPDQVTALDDQVYVVHWSPRGDWLAFQYAPGGGVNTQVAVVRPDGTDLRLLTAGGRDCNWLQGFTPDGASLKVTSSIRRADAVDAYLVDLESGEFRQVAEGRAMCELSDVSADGRTALLQRNHFRGNNDVFLLDLGSGEETLLTAHEGPGAFGQARFGADGRTVFLTSNADADLVALARVRTGDGGEVGPIERVCARDDAELELFSISPDRHTALLVWNVAGRAEPQLVDLDTLAVEENVQLPGELLGGWYGAVSWSPDSRRLAISVTGSTLPDDIWLLDRGAPNPAQVTRSPHAGVVLDDLVRPELLQFPAEDGVPLSGWLYRARNGDGRAIMSFHGGPEGQERPSFRDDYQALLQRGISIFAPNVRGSSGFGKAFINLDNGELRFNGIRDIKDCVGAAVEAGVAEPGHIGIMGGSYGGYMTMAGLAWYPELFAAGANLFGVVNFATFFAQTEPWMAAISKVKYGDPDTQAELLHELSPLSRIDRVVAPTIVLHGANDTNVPVIEAEQVVESLRTRGVPCEYVLFPDEGHGFLKAANRITANVAIARWFEQYL
jgi:dipeptidyl aminopeptidase/acylaminoacyl peptidase